MSLFLRPALLTLVVLAFAGAPRAVLAQRAVLYEEDGAVGRRLVGSVTWQSTRMWVGAGHPLERDISADVVISERGRVTLTLRRNNDTTLSASHVVEVYFRSDGGTPTAGIAATLGMLTRQSENERAAPIAGAAVKGQSSSFLIGLSDVEADKQRNLYLLKESAWLDVVIVYRNGRRAILSIEKGAEGKRMFNNAFAEWGYTRLTAPPPAKAPPPATPGSPKSSAQASRGTGFFLSSDGHVVTNAHVVRECGKISVRKPAEPPVTARVLARVDTDDLAVLKIERRQEAAATLRAMPSPRAGEAIVVFGFPLSGILASSGNATIGNITALAGLGDDPRQLQISAPVQPGNSGGPVLDASGNVIGVVVSKLDALVVARLSADIPQNINFAVKSSTLVNFLDARGFGYSSSQLGEALSVPDIVERAKAISVEVHCDK